MNGTGCGGSGKGWSGPHPDIDDTSGGSAPGSTADARTTKTSGARRSRSLPCHTWRRGWRGTAGVLSSPNAARAVFCAGFVATPSVFDGLVVRVRAYDGYCLPGILFYMFSWNQSWTLILSYIYLSIFYLLPGHSVSRTEIICFFSTLHMTLDSRSVIRTSMKRLLAEMLKEKHSVSIVYSDTSTHIFVIMFLSKVAINFSHITWHTNTYERISLIIYPISYFFLKIKVKYR